MPPSSPDTTLLFAPGTNSSLYQACMPARGAVVSCEGKTNAKSKIAGGKPLDFAPFLGQGKRGKPALQRQKRRMKIQAPMNLSLRGWHPTF